MKPDLILHNGRFTTLDRGNPNATAVAIKDGLFEEVGTDAEIMALAGSGTKIVDLKGRRVLPGVDGGGWLGAAEGSAAQHRRGNAGHQKL